LVALNDDSAVSAARTQRLDCKNLRTDRRKRCIIAY
jgi:hypothetical protein